VKLDLNDLKKLKADRALKPELAPEKKVVAIIRVRDPGYVPEKIHIRSRIDDNLFTAEFPAAQLEVLRTDRRVSSVEVSQPLKQID
jgi:hypothetical protein